MSDNYIHKIDFEDLETFHTILHMPRPNNRVVDREHQFILEEETHPGNGFIKAVLSNIGDRWQKARSHTAPQTSATTQRVALKQNSLVRR